MIEIKLPQMGMGMTDGTIIRWFKSEGDRIVEGEPLAEVEAAKTMFEVTSPSSGLLSRILVTENTNVPVQTVLALLQEEGASTVIDVQIPAAESARTTPVSDERPGAPAGAAKKTGVQVEPAARRLAKELSIDLAAIVGSGPGGRVTDRDVHEAAARLSSVGQVMQPTAAEYEDIPHSSMRRIIAQRLTQAKQEAPHFYLVARCDVDSLLSQRARIKAEQPDAALSVNDFVVKAVADALRCVPTANVSWTEAALRRYNGVDVAVAVAVPGGLITPVIRNADRKTLLEVAAEIARLRARAIAGGLTPPEYKGGVATVSNLGMYGVEEFTAIINPPQSCIFAIGAATERPVVRNGRVEIAKQITCTLSVDHRALDGAVAAELLRVFKSSIENPNELIGVK